MEKFYSILIDLAVLGFFGMLYYFIQKRRIIKASVLEVQAAVQEFLYELHSFLERNKSANYYKELDDFARKLETAANSNELDYMQTALNRIPANLPEKLKNDLRAIKELF